MDNRTCTCTSDLPSPFEVMKEKHISVAFHAIHNRLTGGAKVFFEHANYLFRQGVPVSIVSRDEKPDWMLIDAPWIRIPLAAKTQEKSPSQPQGLQPSPDLSPLRGLYDIGVEMFWTGVPDLFRLDPPVKVLFEQGSPELFEAEHLPGRAEKAFRMCYSSPIQLITVSKKASSVIKTRFGRSSTVIPNAIDHTVFFPKPKIERAFFTVILVGSDVMDFKGIGDGLSAIEQLRQKGYPIEVIQVTPGGRTIYKTRRRVVYRPSPQHLADLYREADVYLGCSWYESFSLPPLEAMACGTAVVTTDNGGVREYAVPEENCLLAPPKDPVRLAQQLERILTEKTLRHRLAAKGIETARNFTWDKASQAFAKALLEFSSGVSLNLFTRLNAFHRTAAIFLERGDFEGAKELLRTALLLDPQNLDTLYNLAYVYAALRDDSHSLELVAEIISQDPSHREALELREFLGERSLTGEPPSSKNTPSSEKTPPSEKAPSSEKAASSKGASERNRV